MEGGGREEGGRRNGGRREGGRRDEGREGGGMEGGGMKEGREEGRREGRGMEGGGGGLNSPRAPQVSCVFHFPHILCSNPGIKEPCRLTPVSPGPLNWPQASTGLCAS